MRPILDLRRLNDYLKIQSFKMETIQTIRAAIRLGDWLCTIDLKDAYLQVPVATEHQRFLRFSIDYQHLQFTCLPFGLATSPRTFSKVLVVVIAKLREEGLEIYQYLDDLLLVAREKDTLERHRDIAAATLERFGWVLNREKSNLQPTQRLVYLGAQIDTDIEMISLPLTRIFKVTEMSSAMIRFGQVSARQFMRYLSTLTSTIGLVKWARWQIRPIQLDVSDPVGSSDKELESEDSFACEPEAESAVVVNTCQPQEGFSFTGARICGTLHRCLRSGLGSSCRELLSPGRMGQGSVSSTIQYTRVEGSKLCTEDFPEQIDFSPCQDSLRHCGSCHIHQETKRNQESCYDGGADSYYDICTGPSNGHYSPSCAGHVESPGRSTQQEEDQQWGMESPSPGFQLGHHQVGPPNNRSYGDNTESEGAEVLLQVSLSPGSGYRCLSPGLDGLVGVCVSPLPDDLQSVAEDLLHSDGGLGNSTKLTAPAMVSTVEEDGPGRANFPADQGGSVVPREPVASESFRVESDGLEAERRRLAQQGCSQAVINTLLKSRKLNTSQRYYATWDVFRDWATKEVIDPWNTTTPEILEFLQRGLDRGLSLSTLRVQLSALSAILERRLIEEPLISRFFKAAVRIVPPVRSLSPLWDLPLVLKALTGKPFEPLDQASLWDVTLKTILLVALTSARRACELQALSARAPYTVFKGDSVVLRPILQFLPKVVSPLHINEPIILPAFVPNMNAQEGAAWKSLDVHYCLQIYLQKTENVRKTDRLFVIPAGPRKGQPAKTATLRRWIVMAIQKAYKEQGEPVPQGIRAHSTRGIASSWAAEAGAQPEAICRAATWATSNTFIRHYKLDIRSTASCFSSPGSGWS
uniref:ribonuclease H n=1 Tax=Xenopus tropicalis TaxID=8364 RepID=A0A803J3I0_XENTR